MSDLQAGRELDARIATDVMGWTEVHLDIDPNGAIDFWTGKAPENRWFNGIDRFSTDIAAAFEVVEKMRDEGWDLWISQTTSMKTEPWDVRLGRGEHHLGNHERAIAHADTAPLAICRAALRAMEAKG